MTTRAPRSLLSFAFAFASLALASGCPKGEPGFAGGPPAELSAKAQLVSDLAMFARGKSVPAAEAEKRAAQLTSGKLTIEKYVDGLLKEPMGARLAKDLVISPSDVSKDRHPIPSHSILRSSGGIYYLAKKCEPEEAVSVKAWFADGADVKVCPDAYRPNVKGDTHGRTCGASMLAPRDNDLCGCGPRLMFCTKDSEHFNKMQDEVQQEVLDTTAYVVDGDRPIEELFTMNGSVRNASSEVLYRRARIAAGESEELLPVTGFPTGKEAELRPRHDQVPGQHAGVLSTPALTYSSDALRGVLRNYYDYLWCTGVSSSRVSTDKILGLDVVDLRVGDGWKQLASMDVCTDCHARLDYGMQFFWGYPSSTMGLDFRPKEARTGKGQLYGHNIEDERGSDELTPLGFAKLATSQPEFGKCMTRKVVDHVFNGTEKNEDFKAVLETFKETHRIKAMLRTAMLRYAEANKNGRPAPAPVGPPIASGTAGGESEGNVKLTKSLRAMLDDKCMQCHDEGDPYDFNGKELPRTTLLAMIDQVGFGAMPKTMESLEEDERAAFVRELAPLVFSADEDDRKAALDYFGNGLRALPVHRFRTSMSNVHARAAGKGSAFRPTSIESAVDQSQMLYTPGMAVSAAVAAVRSCRDPKGDKAKIEACIARATAPTAVIVGAVN